MLQIDSTQGLLAQQLSQLIALIYQTASDAGSWELLLERFSEAAVAQSLAPGQATDQVLTPHFAQANRLLGEVQLGEQGLDLLEQTLNRLPMAVAIVDMQARVWVHNTALQQLLQRHAALFLQQMQLHTRPANALAQALTNLQAGATNGLPIKLIGDEVNLPVLTLSLTRLDMPVHAADAILLIATDRQQPLFSAEALQQQYALTPAEARLVQQLLLGDSLEEACATLSVSINTGKTHLKQIFIKCGVKRQSELIQQVYRSPLWLLCGLQPSVDIECSASTLAPPLVRFVKLADGRRLAYVDRGDPNGIPLVFTRGILGSRLTAHPDEQVLWDKRIRLLVPDRPGSGQSDPNPQHSLLSWADDVRQWMAHLGIERWQMMGFATGAAYALACAHQLPKQVISVVLTGAAPPINGMGDLRFFHGDLKHGLMLCRYSPALAPHVYGLLTKNLSSRVHQYFNDTVSVMPLCDQRVFADNRLRQNEANAVLEGAVNGNLTFMNELFIAGADWGFELKQIHTPLSLWHGKLDPYVGWQASEKMAAQCPHAKLHLLDDAGQYLIYSHWSQLLDEVLGLAASAGLHHP